MAQLDGAKHLVLAGAAADALLALADELAPGSTAPVAPASRPPLPTGALSAAAVADVIGAIMPERAIVVDDFHLNRPRKSYS